MRKTRGSDQKHPTVDHGNKHVVEIRCSLAARLLVSLTVDVFPALDRLQFVLRIVRGFLVFVAVLFIIVGLSSPERRLARNTLFQYPQLSLHRRQDVGLALNANLQTLKP